MFMILQGVIENGSGDFTQRMTRFPEVFERVAGKPLYPGTINVRVHTALEIAEAFRIRGSEIDEHEQDLLFERCTLCIEDARYEAFRIRPFVRANGAGGHGDNVLEITAFQRIPGIAPGVTVQVEFDRVEREIL